MDDGHVQPFRPASILLLTYNDARSGLYAVSLLSPPTTIDTVRALAADDVEDLPQLTPLGGGGKGGVV